MSNPFFKSKTLKRLQEGGAPRQVRGRSGTIDRINEYIQVRGKDASSPIKELNEVPEGLVEEVEDTPEAVVVPVAVESSATEKGKEKEEKEKEREKEKADLESGKVLTRVNPLFNSNKLKTFLKTRPQKADLQARHILVDSEEQEQQRAHAKGMLGKFLEKKKDQDKETVEKDLEDKHILVDAEEQEQHKAQTKGLLGKFLEKKKDKETIERDLEERHILSPRPPASEEVTKKPEEKENGHDAAEAGGESNEKDEVAASNQVEEAVKAVEEPKEEKQNGNAEHEAGEQAKEETKTEGGGETQQHNGTENGEGKEEEKTKEHLAGSAALDLEQQAEERRKAREEKQRKLKEEEAAEEEKRRKRREEREARLAALNSNN